MAPIQRSHIVIEEGLMTVMDAEGNGYDCHVLSEGSHADAEAQIDRWAEQFEFDVSAAKRELAAYIAEL